MNRFFLSSLFSVVLLLLTTYASSATVGTWRLYNSYSNITNVEPLGNYIFALADGNLFSYNKTDHSVEEHNKLTGLTSQNITNIAACRTAKKLLIIYEDYSIDLLPTDFGKEVTTIIGLKEKLTAKDKTITDIHVNGKYAYITTQELGTIKINTLNGTIEETYTHGESIPDDERTAMTVDEYKNISGDAKPDGPSDNNFFRLYINNGKLYATSGIADGPTLSVRPPAIHYTSLNPDITWDDLPIPDVASKTSIFNTTLCMTFDPNDASHFFVGTSFGILEYRNYSIDKTYNTENSTLKTNEIFIENTFVSSLLYDKDKNLWAFNGFFNILPLNIMDAQGNWEVLNCKTNDVATQNRSLEGAFISKTNGLMWFVNSNWDRSVCYSYNMETGMLNSYKNFVNQDGLNINSNPYFFCPTEDADGNIWIPTSDGPVYLSKEDIERRNCVFTQPKINRNDGTDLADYLLSDVYCYVIKIDKAGRKWIGTKDAGVFVIGADNATEIYNFTTENSPLPSNEIYDIAIDESTGIVYIATIKGLCSYQTDVTSDYGSLDEDKVYAYPNPVSPDYTGPITIKGLYENCQLKITTSSGYVVHKGIVSGASYQWDGCDRNGDRVASGVYMVLIETPEGTKGCVTKIAMIK
jgi:hypothetical protein